MIADDMMTFIKNDIVVFGLGVLLFIIATLWFVFRKIIWIVVPISSCFFSVIIMMGLLGLLGWKVTVISSNFIALMLILTMAMNIHMSTRFLQLTKQMTFSENGKFELAFSPDDSRIAFTQNNQATNFDIMSVATEGGDIQQHTRDESWELHPRWLDNRTLLYTYRRQEDAYRTAAQVNTATGQVTPLVSDDQGHVVMPFAISAAGDVKYQRGWPSGPLVSFSTSDKATNVLIDGRIGRPVFNGEGTHVAYVDMLKYPKPIIWRENVERIVKPARLP